MSGSESNSSQLVPVDEDLYVVEAIKDKRMVAGKPQYLVKWLHWDRPQDLTWEPIANLSTVHDLIQIYENKISATKKENVGFPIKSTETPSKKQLPKLKKIRKQHTKKTQTVKKQQKQVKKQKKQIQIESSESDDDSSQSEQVQNSSQHKTSKISSNRINKIQFNQPQIGCFNGIYVRDDGEVFYEADVMNKKGQTIGVILVPKKQIRPRDKQLLLAFLQTYLVEEDRYSQMF